MNSNKYINQYLMNPFLNPVNAIPFIKDYIFAPRRIERLNHKKIKRYRDKAINKTIKYSYRVPLYKEKYRNEGIHPNSIKGINDIIKLPFITKKDLIDNYPNRIIPKDYSMKKAHLVCTSGSTGKAVAIFSDFPTFSIATTQTIRELQMYNLNWYKSRIAYIINYTPNKINDVVDKVVLSKARSLGLLKNHLHLNPFDPIYDIIEKLNKFKPDTIASYPVTFQHLAYLKMKGYGKEVNPKALIVGGYVLDSYTKNYVEDAFRCKMFNVYGSAESLGDIAYECKKGTWHINYDFYHVESIDKNMNLVSPDEKGRIVITRMFGKGTPIVRYIGMDDWVTLTTEYKCECGLYTPTIKDGVEGRLSTSIVLPDGRIYPSATFAKISVLLSELKTNKVKQFQIVQKMIDEIDIYLVFDEDLRDLKPSVDYIIQKIKDEYVKMVGPSVKISVLEKKEINSGNKKPTPFVISHIKPDKIYQILDSIK